MLYLFVDLNLRSKDNIPSSVHLPFVLISDAVKNPGSLIFIVVLSFTLEIIRSHFFLCVIIYIM
jgi:hypothetical protein